MIKGQKVYLPYHECYGTVNSVFKDSACIQYKTIGNTPKNLWTDLDGKLPDTDLQLILLPKYSNNELVTSKKEDKLIVGRIVDVYTTKIGFVYFVETLDTVKRKESTIVHIEENQLYSINDLLNDKQRKKTN